MAWNSPDPAWSDMWSTSRNLLMMRHDAKCKKIQNLPQMRWTGVAAVGPVGWSAMQIECPWIVGQEVDLMKRWSPSLHHATLDVPRSSACHQDPPTPPGRVSPGSPLQAEWVPAHPSGPSESRLTPPGRVSPGSPLRAEWVPAHPSGPSESRLTPPGRVSPGSPLRAEWVPAHPSGPSESRLTPPGRVSPGSALLIAHWMLLAPRSGIVNVTCLRVWDIEWYLTTSLG